jgi:single-strand DNA-binding protein
MINHFTVLGNITKDPECKFITGGKEISNFSIAYNKVTKGTKETYYFDCTAFEKQANFINTYLKKGARVIVEGSLRQEKWDDKTTGQKRTKISVVVSRCVSLDKKSDSTDETTHPEPEHVPAVDEGEIPF